MNYCINRISLLLLPTSCSPNRKIPCPASPPQHLMLKFLHLTSLDPTHPFTSSLRLLLPEWGLTLSLRPYLVMRNFPFSRENVGQDEVVGKSTQASPNTNCVRSKYSLYYFRLLNQRNRLECAGSPLLMEFMGVILRQIVHKSLSSSQLFLLEDTEE